MLLINTGFWNIHLMLNLSNYSFLVSHFLSLRNSDWNFITNLKILISIGAFILCWSLRIGIMLLLNFKLKWGVKILSTFSLQIILLYAFLYRLVLKITLMVLDLFVKVVLSLSIPLHTVLLFWDHLISFPYSFRKRLMNKWDKGCINFKLFWHYLKTFRTWIGSWWLWCSKLKFTLASCLLISWDIGLIPLENIFLLSFVCWRGMKFIRILGLWILSFDRRPQRNEAGSLLLFTFRWYCALPFWLFILIGEIHWRLISLYLIRITTRNIL